MRLLLLVLVACSTTSEPVVPPPPGDAAPRIAVGCEGYWSLVELFPTRTTCSGLGRHRADIIVDVVDGAYRARHATGGTFAITHASAPGEACVLALAESGHVEATDTSYAMAWQIGGATNGVYRDTEAWTECTHEFRALAVRRDVQPADLALDDATVRADVLAWWPRYAACRRLRLRAEPGRTTLDAALSLDADGRVTKLHVRGRTEHVDCSMYGCPCLAVANPTGRAQTVAVPLPVP